MRSILALALAFSLTLAARAEFRAGAAAVDVTPEKYPVIVNGGFLERIATSSIDKLHARALVLDDGKTRLAICVVDSCMMPREFLDKVKYDASKPAGIPVENMCISATHTHSAPAVMGCLGVDADKVYPEFLHRQIVRAITLAAKDLKPAKAGWGVTHAPKHTYNRRWILRSDKVRNDPFGNPTVRANMHPGYQHPDFIGPSGPVDDSLTLLSVRTADDKPLCVLANFSMHYFGSPACSSDYFGPFCEKLSKKVGGGVGIMSQGTSGDLMWMDYGSPEKKITLDQYAGELADIAFAAFQKIEYKTDVPLKMKETKLTLKRRVPDAARLKWARETMAKVTDGKVKTQQEIYAREAIYLHEEPQRELKLQAIRVGNFGVYAIPNEVYAITGLRLKHQMSMPRPVVIELANGAEGYIPTTEQHHFGGYTTWPARTAALEATAERKIIGSLEQSMIALFGKLELSSVNGANDGPEGRVATWSFDEQLESESMEHRHSDFGEVFEPGTAFFLPSRFNRCAHFAGGRMKAHLKDLGPTYTAEFWVWNGFPTNVRPVTGYMFSRGEDGAKDAPGDHLGIGGTHSHAGKLIFFNGNKADTTLGGKTPLKLKEWHHVALVRDGKKVQVYLDGKLDIEGEAEVTVPKGCRQFFFGGRNDKFAGLEGRMDEAAIYNRALTAKEIAEHHAAAKP